MGITQVAALTKETRRQEVIRIFRENPHVRTAEVAKTLNVKRSTINNDINELAEELRHENPQNWHLHRERMLLSLNNMMKKCMDKLELCRGATSGTRWVEEWTKLFEKEAKILGVYSADRTIVGHVDLDKIITKEQRDASLDALIGGQQKGMIDITPKNETAKTK